LAKVAGDKEKKRVKATTEPGETVKLCRGWEEACGNEHVKPLPSKETRGGLNLGGTTRLQTGTAAKSKKENKPEREVKSKGKKTEEKKETGVKCRVGRGNRGVKAYRKRIKDIQEQTSGGAKKEA